MLNIQINEFTFIFPFETIKGSLDLQEVSNVEPNSLAREDVWDELVCWSIQVYVIIGLEDEIRNLSMPKSLYLSPAWASVCMTYFQYFHILKIKFPFPSFFKKCSLIQNLKSANIISKH